MTRRSDAFVIGQNDQLPKLERVPVESDGSVTDLAAATGAVFRMRAIGSGSLKVDAAATIENVTVDLGDGNGEQTLLGLTYDWPTAADTDTVGVYDGQFEVTFSSGTLKVPNAEPFQITVAEELA